MTSAASADCSPSTGSATTIRCWSSSTDGVGTKSLIARMANRRNTIGIDCVAMSVDDIAAQGAEPLFFLDYISIGKLVPDEIDELVAGVAEGCRRRTLRAARRRDVGASRRDGAGRVRSRRVRGRGRRTFRACCRARCRPATSSSGSRARGCAATAIRSHAPRSSNGRAATSTTRRGPARTSRSADVLLEPSVIYAPRCWNSRRKVPVRAFAHITGGGLPGNVEPGARPITATRSCTAARGTSRASSR